jgi:hypothetical protein
MLIPAYLPRRFALVFAASRDAFKMTAEIAFGSKTARVTAERGLLPVTGYVTNA